MGKKKFTITEDMFNNKYLTKLMDLAEKLSPAKTVNEQEIRAKDRRLVAEGMLGEPVEKPSANINGKLDRNKILTATTLFGDKPRVTENDIKLIAEAGFDFIINDNRKEYGRQILDWCEKYNVAVIGNEIREFISNKGIDIDASDESKNIFADFKPHPASVGDIYCDEPHISAFAKIAKFHRIYEKCLPNRVAFSNLFPSCAVKSAMGTKTYREYIDGFSKENKSDYLSVDIYPFHPSKLMNKYEMMKCLETYHTLANACRRDGKDFWLYIQTQMKWFSHIYTYTTFEMIKWQYYASIAYGCRCIINASYNPVWGNDAIGIIDYNGKLTEQYLYVKRINKEIVKLSPIVKDFKSIGVKIYNGKKQNPHFVLAAPKQNRDSRLEGFNGIPEVRSIEGESTVLAGFFKAAQGKKAIMLVNCKDIYNPYASQNIVIKHFDKTRVRIYKHGELSRTEDTLEISVEVGSCDGVFIILE